MDIEVVGYGVVGSAQAFLLKHLGHRVHVYDPLKGMKEFRADAQMAFVCTPENVVESAVADLIGRGFSGLVVVKSTVPVGTTACLMKKFGRHFCHNPEFLREAHAFYDVMNPSRIVIGECCSEHGRILEELYGPLKSRVYRTDPTTSEIIKLVSNSLRALNISFWNELFLLCQKVDADIKVVAEAADPAKVLGEWEGGGWGTRFFGKPYGGKCLPKDIKHLIAAFKKSGLNPRILEAAEEVNDLVGRLV